MPPQYPRSAPVALTSSLEEKKKVPVDGTAASNSASVRQEVTVTSPSPMRSSYPGGGHSMSYGSMGMPYGMMGMGMMGMGAAGGSNNPVMWIYSINQMIYSISYALDMIGMNSQQIQALASRLYQIQSDVMRYLRSLKLVIWLRKRCKRSKIFRTLLICSTIVLTHHIAKFIKKLNSNEGFMKMLSA